MPSSTSAIPLPSFALVKTASLPSSPMDVFELLPYALWFGTGQIDFVNHGENFELMVKRQIGVGQRLRLDPLGRVDDQDGALAGGQTTRHLIGKINGDRGYQSGSDNMQRRPEPDSAGGRSGL